MLSATPSAHAACPAAVMLIPRTLVSIPKRTYASVPQEVLNAGHRINWIVNDWRGEYQLWPLPVWDSARRFTSAPMRS